MSELLSISDCIEVDITYRSAVELQYLFNVVSFNYHTMKCKYVYFSSPSNVSMFIAGMVVARVRLNRIDTNAYAQCFKAIFDAVAKEHPMFKIGESLNGIIADWSDQQAKGLEIAIGKTVANEILKGCQVFTLATF